MATQIRLKPASSLTTRRLALCPFSVADAIDLFSIRGDSHAMRFWDWPADETLEQTREMARLFQREIDVGAALCWAARARSGEFIGVFDLSTLRCASAELGFMVVRRHWGQGYATEAAGAVIGEARRRGCARLNARIHAGNDASRRLLEKLGFHAARADDMFEAAPGRLVLCAFFELDLAVPELGPSRWIPR